MSMSLQNFLYFPPFCMLPAADELDANYYAENGQGKSLSLGKRSARFNKRLMGQLLKVAPGCMGASDTCSCAEVYDSCTKPH